MMFIDERKIKINGVEILECQLGSACEVYIDGQRVNEKYEDAIRRVVEYYTARTAR